MDRKGISLVALVITIIVLIILTGAVVINAINVPNNASITVFYNNIGTLQDVVTMKMLNNLTENAENFNENAKWIGVIKDYGIDDIDEAPEFITKINGVDVAQVDESMKDIVAIDDEEFTKYYVSRDGAIYHMGYESGGRIYHNQTVSTPPVESIEVVSGITKTEYIVGDKIDLQGLVIKAKYDDGTEGNILVGGCTFNPALKDATAVEGQKQIQVSYGGKTADVKIEIEVDLPQGWTVASLNADNRAVSGEIKGITYYAPIPKGFTVSTNSKEDQIEEGLVIKDASGNEFVWVPVNGGYDITNALNTQITNKTALAYWQDAKNAGGTGAVGSGYNEPYTRTAGSWTNTEWENMMDSVLKYGGFYIGRYEAAGTVNELLVQKGEMPITKIAWGSSMTEAGSNTATAVSRAKYTGDQYGLASTLMYGIQWDSIMNWANCVSETREPIGKKVASGDVVTDCYKNIYDLAGNVRKWTKEGYNTGSRVHCGGSYNSATGGRSNLVPNLNIISNIGFRIALYVK